MIVNDLFIFVIQSLPYSYIYASEIHISELWDGEVPCFLHFVRWLVLLSAHTVVTLAVNIRLLAHEGFPPFSPACVTSSVFV